MIPLWDTKSIGHGPALWTYIIIAINVFVFYLELTNPNPDSFITRYALIPALIDFSDYRTWTPFITSQFLHGGFLHIISNMWFLKIFGDNVEHRFGFLFFPIFYLMAGVAGALIQFFFSIDSTIPMLGASGAIAGVLGAYFAMFPRNQIKTLVPFFGFLTVLNLSAWIMLVYWFATQIFSGFASITMIDVQSGGVAYFAHIGGFVFGWLIGHFFKKCEVVY